MIKKTAIIYTRVSTDEQNRTGYSLQDQEEKLHRHCLARGIQVIEHYQDDYSAKTFDRPQYKKLMEFLKKNKGTVGQVLFVNWSRFTRETADGYDMLSKLTALGVEANAIEQPIDFKVPEQRVMLAIYLAIPHAENHRRSINTFSGMRQAMKQGRYVSTPPKGYKFNHEGDKPVLVHNQDAPLILLAYEQISKDVHSAQDVYFQLRRKLNYKGSRNQFYNILRNPLYAGWVRVPKTEEEPEVLVKGIHEAIVPQELFNRVQDIMSGKRKIVTKTSTNKIVLPLRGMLICKRCGRNLTGSGSPNRAKNIYFYYHCTTQCGERIPADKANQALTALLGKMVFPPEFIRYYYAVLKDVFKCSDAERLAEIKKLNNEIQALETKIQNVEDSFFSKEVSLDTYESVKGRYSRSLDTLIGKKVQLELLGTDFNQYVKYGLSLINNLPKYYTSATTEVKMKLLCLMFPEKLKFDNEAYQTPKMHPIFTIFSLKSNKLKNSDNMPLHATFNTAPPIEPLSNTLAQGFKELYELSEVLKVEEIAF